MADQRPLLAITMGDAAGIGPEVVARALAEPEVAASCRALVIGDATVLRATLEGLGSRLSLHAVTAPGQARYDAGTLTVLDLRNIRIEALPRGQVSAMAGHAAFEYVDRAIALAMDGQVEGIVTAPLNKEAMHLGGHAYPGHTEILAEKTGTDDFTMMLASDTLRVVLVTIHVALRQAIEMVDRARVLRTLRLADRALKGLGIAAPRLAVCGLNPHAGEGGLFGREDAEEIAPAVQDAQQEGIGARGPFPADTVFFRAVRGDFDAVVAMYHDQGLIPLKTLDFSTGVNMTLGLPIIRTSVDHGTAFDIAWTWQADHRSMVAAVRMAVQMAERERLTARRDLW